MAESRTRELVHRLEPSASAAPRMNQARVAALAALGFGYIILMLLAVLAALVGVVYLAATSHAAMLVKLAIPLLALLAAILRSFWVRIEAPKRLPVARSDSP